MSVTPEPVLPPATSTSSGNVLRGRPGPVEQIERAERGQDGQPVLEDVGFLDLSRVADAAPYRTATHGRLLRKLLQYARLNVVSLDGQQVRRFTTVMSCKQAAREIRSAQDPYSMRWIRELWGDLVSDGYVIKQCADRYGPNTWVFDFAALERLAYGEHAPPSDRERPFDVRGWMPPVSAAEAQDAQRIVVEVCRRVLGEAPTPAQLRLSASSILATWRRLRAGADGPTLTVDEALARLDRVLEAVRTCRDQRWDWFRGIDQRRRPGSVARPRRPAFDHTRLPSKVFGLVRSERRYALVEEHFLGSCACHSHVQNGGQNVRGLPPPVEVDAAAQQSIEVGLECALSPDLWGATPLRIRLLVDAGRRDELVGFAVRRRHRIGWEVGEPSGQVYWPADLTSEELVTWLDRLAGELAGRPRDGPAP